MRQALVLCLLLLAACRTPSGSAVKDDEPVAADGTCPCSDLACWRDKSNEAAVQQLECAKDALTSAASLSTGGLANAVQITSGLIDVGQALADQNLYALLSSVAGTGEIAVDLFGAEGKPLVECVKGSAALVSQIFGVVDIMRNYKPEGTEGLTDVVKAVGGSMDANHNFAKAMLECLRLAKALDDNESIKSFNKFMEGWEKIMSNVEAAIAVVSCGAKISNGGMVLIQNTQCLVEDLKNLEESRKAVARALAFDGSRAFNHARFSGCGCIETHWWQSASTELDKCRECCDGTAPGVMRDEEPNKRSLWTEECKLSCNVAYTEGIFVNYIDEKNCEEVKQRTKDSPERVVYRYLDLVDKNSHTPAKQQAEEERGRVLAALQQLKSNFDAIDGACPDREGAADGLLSRGELACCAEQQKGGLKAACQLFGVWYKGDDGLPYYYRLLDTAAGLGGEDNRAGANDVDAFIEEVTRYQDESETH